MCSHFGLGVYRRHMLSKTARALPRTLNISETARAQPQTLNILTVREPMGLSLRRRLILLASHRMALTREQKNPGWITWEIEIFSIFAWSVPTLVPKHKSRFRVFRSTTCLCWWSINIYETFGRRKLQFHCGILLVCLAQKQLQIWGRCFSSIIGCR